MAQAYSTDLSDTEWKVLELLIPGSKPCGRPRTTDIRAMVSAIFYVLRSGCQWRMMPKEYPPHLTVYVYFCDWRLTEIWERIHDKLRGDVHEAAGAIVCPVCVSSPFGHVFQCDSTTDSNRIRPLIPESFGRAVGAKRRRGV